MTFEGSVNVAMDKYVCCYRSPVGMVDLIPERVQDCDVLKPAAL